MKTYSRVYFSLCLFLAISRRSRTPRKFNPREKIPIYGIFFAFKTFRVCNFAKSEEKCMKHYINLVWVCGNKDMNFLIHLTIILEFPKILQNVRKIYSFH